MSKGVTDEQAILAKGHALGWRVRLVNRRPTLVRATPHARPVPPGLLRELKVNRIVIVRHILIAQVLARSAGKKVFGYYSDERRPVLLRKELLAHWNRICVEGDQEWTILPDAPGDDSK